MNNIVTRSGTTRRSALVTGTLTAVSLVAAACGGGSSAPGSVKSSAGTTTVTATATTGPTTTASTVTSHPAAAGAFVPAASGQIASITGRTLEVQSTESGQTTVDLTAKTKVTATVAVSISAITPGTCIMATGTKDAAGIVAATSIAVEPAVKGNCTTGVGPGGGAPGGPGSLPTPVTGKGSVPKVARPANFTAALGRVTSVSASTITIEGSLFSSAGFSTGKLSSSGTTIATPVAKKFVVTVSAKTRYSKTETAKASTLKVGECATAYGSTNDIGAVTAARLTVTQATTTGCPAFGGFGGGGGPGPGSGGGTGVPVPAAGGTTP